MTARFKLICALVLLAAALAALLYFKPGKQAAPEYTISDLTADAIKSVQIERPGKERVALESRDGKWRVSAPFAARVDLAQVENLLSLVTAKSTVRYPQAELARFDLDQPLLKVNINDQEVLFGGINPLSGEQYVGTRGHIYLISPRHGSAAQAESWASRKLLAEDEEPARFEFPSFAVVKSEDRWSLSPQSGEPAQEDFNIWLNRWRLATSLSTAPATSMQGTQFKITLADGKQIPMTYGEKGSEFFFVRHDEQLQYQFAPAIGKPLVEPPAAVLPHE